MAFCINCGQELPEGAKFCANCGTSANGTNQGTQRKTIYEGEIHKCPSCGEVLASFVVVCPSCGYEIRGNKSSHTMTDFSAMLSEVDDDTKRIALIHSFPIPNNKEDILEIMILAHTNFDSDAQIDGIGIKKELAEAWLSKIEQAYQKATLLFSNDMDFSKIQSVYIQTAKKIKYSSEMVLKKRIVKSLLKTICMWGGMLLFVFAYINSHIFYGDSSVIELVAMIFMTVGALIVGRNIKFVDIGIGAFSAAVTIFLGTTHGRTFNSDGSAMLLSGVLALIILAIQLIVYSAKNNKEIL